MCRKAEASAVAAYAGWGAAAYLASFNVFNAAIREPPYNSSLQYNRHVQVHCCLKGHAYISSATTEQGNSSLSGCV
jgi:hypothetical protein